MTDVEILLVDGPITRERLLEVASLRFGDLVKAVVDIEKGVMAIGGELHSDEEAFLLERESAQKDLWGINIYPDRAGDEMIEFDSMINVRPSQNNRSRTVDDVNLRTKILEIVNKLVI